MELVRERARQQYLQWVVEDPTRAKMYAEQKTSGRERQKQTFFDNIFEKMFSDFKNLKTM